MPLALELQKNKLESFTDMTACHFVDILVTYLITLAVYQIIQLLQEDALESSDNEAIVT
jgi:hypothetical protein